MNIAKIAFTVLLTVPILILIMFLLTKLVSQIGKGTSKASGPRHAAEQKGGGEPEINSGRRTVNTKSEFKPSRRSGKYKT